MFNQSTSRRFFLRRDRNTPIHVGSTESISPHRENLPSTRDGKGIPVGFRLKANPHAPAICHLLRCRAERVVVDLTQLGKEIAPTNTLHFDVLNRLCASFQLGGGMESYAPFLKQHALVVKGLHNVWLKPCPEGFRCSAFIAVVAHEDMSV